MMNKVMQKIHSIPKRRWRRINYFMRKLYFARELVREVLKERGRNRHYSDNVKLWKCKT